MNTRIDIIQKIKRHINRRFTPIELYKLFEKQVELTESLYYSKRKRGVEWELDDYEFYVISALTDRVRLYTDLEESQVVTNQLRSLLSDMFRENIEQSFEDLQDN